MYYPELLISKEFFLKNETLASVCGVENHVVRLDSFIKNSLCADAVRKTLIRADGLGTLLVDGVVVDISTLMRIEAADSILGSQENTNEALRSLLFEEKLNNFDEALKIYRFMQTVDWITDDSEERRIDCIQDILDLYSRAEYGPSLQGKMPSFRSHPHAFEKTDRAKRFYKPVDSQLLHVFMSDFCEFINKNTMTPLSQASIAQFQFETLKPFEENLDRMERLIMYYIVQRRKLHSGIVLPLNLFSAHFKDRFYQLFEPYLSAEKSIGEDFDLAQEQLVLHTAKVAKELVLFTVSLHKMIRALVGRWRERLGHVERGSALELLLYQFAGSPIMTISQAANTINKSFSTTSVAFDRLKKAKIVIEEKPIRRNKIFEAPEAIFLHDNMYRKKAVSYDEFVS